MSPMQREARAQLEMHLAQSLMGRVGLDVWTRKESGLVLPDRDSCTHCDTVAENAREIATTHSAVTFTPYDLDRHADRAEEAGIERAPTTVIRGGGRSLRFVGLWSGGLFAAFVDILVLLGNGQQLLAPESRETLVALPRSVDVELAVTPFEQLSPQMALLMAAVAAETRSVRVTITEYAEFPKLAGTRSLTQVPTVWIDGQRFEGMWSEPELVEQISRVAQDDAEPVMRERIVVVPYVSEEQAGQLAQQMGAEQPGGATGAGLTPSVGGPAAPQTGASGLFVPGRG